MTAMQDLKEDLELAIDSANDALNDIIDETTRSRCKIVVKITIGDILKRINNELLQKEKQQIIDFSIWFNNNDNSYKSYEEIVDKYYDSTFGDNPEAGI